MCDIAEVRRLLRSKSSKKAKESYKKFVERLWKGEYLEEKILAAKILGGICNKNPDLTMKLVKKFVKDIDNWAVCDVLATQGIRKIAKVKQDEIIAFSKKLVKSKNIWERRFGIVLLLNYKKDKSLRKEIRNIIKYVEKDKEYYVKKAVDWIKRSLQKY